MLDNVREIHIEPTSLCNAECPMCARNVYGKMINPYIKLKSLPLSWFKQNIAPAQIKNLDKIFFCGNVGDPATAPEHAPKTVALPRSSHSAPAHAITPAAAAK